MPLYFCYCYLSLWMTITAICTIIKQNFLDQSFDQVVFCVFSTGHNYVLLASLLLSSFEACWQKAVTGLKTGIIKCIWNVCFSQNKISSWYIMKLKIIPVIVQEKAQIRLYFLRKLKKATVQSQILADFYGGAIESILPFLLNITN